MVNSNRGGSGLKWILSNCRRHEIEMTGVDYNLDWLALCVEVMWLVGEIAWPKGKGREEKGWQHHKYPTLLENKPFRHTKGEGVQTLLMRDKSMTLQCVSATLDNSHTHTQTKCTCVVNDSLNWYATPGCILCWFIVGLLSLSRCICKLLPIALAGSLQRNIELIHFHL